MVVFLFEIILICFAVGAGAIVMFAAVHDVLMSFRQPLVAKAERKLTVRRQPQVSVIVLHITSPDQVVVQLRSLHRASYKKKSVVFVVSESVDRATRRDIRRTCRANHVAVYRPIKQVNEEGCIRAARRKLPRDVFYLTLDASMVLEPHALKRAVALLESRPITQAAVLWHKTNDPDSLLGLLRGYAWQSMAMTRKAFTLVGLYRHQDMAGLIRRRTLHNEKQSGSRVPKEYICATTAYIETQGTIRRKITIGQCAIAMLFAGIVAYSSVNAALHISVTPLFLSWLILILWLGASTWFDEGSTTMQKTGSTIGLPVSYFLLPAFMMTEFAINTISRRKSKMIFMRVFSHTPQH